MLRHQTPSPANPIVKLFPRLAPTVVATKVRSSCQDDRTQVRARLLQMILDNERSRRYDHRPDAS